MDKQTEIPFLDDRFKSVEDVIREGLHSEALRNNIGFHSAVRGLYHQYTEAEDSVTAGNASDAGKHRYHYSTLRLVLMDVVRQLDGNVLAGENAKFEKEVE